LRIPKNAVILKGTKEGVFAYLNLSYSFRTILKALEKKLSEREEFFRGGNIKFISVGGDLTDEEMEDISILLKNKFDISGEFQPKKKDEKIPEALSEGTGSGDFKVVRRKIRSGQSLHFKGNLILIGDVNPGGEIRVGGSLFVFGSLRGRVFAGETTGENAIVVASRMKPERLQIGDFVLENENNKRRDTISVALVENEEIKIYPYKNLL